tara:strand:+ start:6514 stop:7284 length:771 start_codon:yes stop_codon:yes gene_type:complete
MIEDIKTFIWFIKKPKFYFTMLSLIIRKLLPNKDTFIEKQKSYKWCKKNCITLEEMFRKYNLEKKYLKNNKIFTDQHTKKINNLISKSKSNFGGQAYINLLYIICEVTNVEHAIETGVAYGWSSAAILKSIVKRSGILISVDMPMIKQEDYHLIGVAVENKWKDNWSLIREPDKYGLFKALKKINYSYDLAHYDSDKSYYGRKWAYPILYKYLEKNGFLISDDIEDNMCFCEFVTKNKLKFSILRCQNKFVGVIRK